MVITGAPVPGGEQSGESYIENNLQITYDVDFKWWCIVINLGLCAVYLAIGCLVCEYIRWDGGHSAVSFAEPLDRKLQRKLFGKIREVGLGRRAKSLIHAVKARLSGSTAGADVGVVQSTAIDVPDEVSNTAKLKARGYLC